jgi:predicted  nucleic acid-binding Zn-ribbon protein
MRGPARAEREGAEQLRQQLSSATERAAAAEVRAGELEARAADLNKELERVPADLGAERQSAVEARQRLEAERDEARKEAQRSAVENSRLIGELEALKTQVREQTAIIKGMAGARERKPTKKTE